jgi:hypothetical protein
MRFIYFLLNELMAFISLIVVFPGFLPPKNRMEWVMCVLMFIPMSVIWWLFLIVFPFVYLVMWWAGELQTFNPYFHEWPFK